MSQFNVSSRKTSINLLVYQWKVIITKYVRGATAAASEALKGLIELKAIRACIRYLKKASHR